MVRAFAEQIFHTGFVHADPHPGNGNIMVVIPLENRLSFAPLIYLSNCFLALNRDFFKYKFQ